MPSADPYDKLVDMLALFNMSPAGLIFIHVIGILAVFVLGYNLGMRKAELQKPRQSNKTARLSSTRRPA
jgi:hypothetical protein